MLFLAPTTSASRAAECQGSSVQPGYDVKSGRDHSCSAPHTNTQALLAGVAFHKVVWADFWAGVPCGPGYYNLLPRQ